MLYIDGNLIKYGFFPNKELYMDTEFLQEMDMEKKHTITLQFINGNDDLIALMLLKGQMDDMGFKDVDLFIPFFPYSTMDHTDGSRPLSLKYVARLINSLNFDTVKVYEPHSTVTEAMIDRVAVGDITEFLLTKAIDSIDKDKSPGKIVVVFPDQGAAKRYETFNTHCDQTISFQKKRDFETGAIKSLYCVDGEQNFNENDVCIIVDDLCRGGRTFMECATILREYGAKTVILCVTHMEEIAFTKGLFDTTSPITRVYTTNSCFSPETIQNAPLYGENKKLFCHFIV